MYGGIKGCKTIPEVGVAIRLPESKMAAKKAKKMKQTLKTFSMQYAHLSVDIQLYHIACIVQWSDSYCWTSLVLHTGMMHTLMSFLGCIGTLMKASCVDMLLIVAFGVVADTITVKWTNALRACHLITTVLLQDFFQSGTKTYQELREYQEAVREHPFERLWVGCLIKLSLLALRLLHAHGDGDFLLQKASRR